MTSRAKTNRANAREHVPTRMCKSAKTCIRGVCCAQYSVESPEVKRAPETESIRRRVQCSDLIFFRNVTNSIISWPVTHIPSHSSSRTAQVEIWGWKRYSQFGLVCRLDQLGLAAAPLVPVALCARERADLSTQGYRTHSPAHDNTVLIRSRRERAL